ncbi:MAG: acyltransferase family protein, partial [Alphaproteobacteria bacterium]|nr:acyltransferase family protein [Alphaproteobacteria bacterium]
FPLGILMARCFRLKVRYRSPAALLIIAVLAALLMLDPHIRWEWLYDSAAIFLVIPAILWAGAIIELPKSLEKIGAILGDISFPVYAVHAPLLQASNYVLIRVLRLSNFAAAITFVISVFLLSWILAIQFDAPVRKWLSGKSHLRPTALPVE